ncbi:MAG: hypothetical protein NTU97_02035 [Candidatus Magasanikbacteria bacterium]|nr:hypothetical protein [Candidatus Magasanikbacteria bacterium]
MEDNGEKETGKPGLRIFIQNGNVSYDPRVEGALVASVFAGPFDPLMSDLGNRASSQILKEQATSAQDEVVSRYEGLKTDLQESANVLAVVYSGLTGFARTNEFVKQLRAEQPHAHIFVVTCDCEYRKKQETYAPLLATGAITGVIFTRECGGRAFMEEIMNQIIQTWSL